MVQSIDEYRKGMTITLTALKRNLNSIDASFQVFDQNKDGKLTEKEYIDENVNIINQILKDVPEEMKEKFFSMSIEGIDDMCSILNGEKVIVFEELPKELEKYCSEKEEELKVLIKKDFDIYDLNKGNFSSNLTILDGKIDFHEWIAISKKMNEKMNTMFDEKVFTTTFKAHDLGLFH